MRFLIHCPRQVLPHTGKVRSAFCAAMFCLLGTTLPVKVGKAQRVGVTTYSQYAGDVFCGEKALISEAERSKTLGGFVQAH